MALTHAVALVHRLGTTALQLTAIYFQHLPLVDSRQHELSYLLSGLRELSVAIHAALLEGFQTSNETLSKAVCSTLQRALHSLEELRNHEYRWGMNRSCCTLYLQLQPDCSAACSQALC
jgi:hypothetical protein